jgi:hypothetical protein
VTRPRLAPRRVGAPCCYVDVIEVLYPGEQAETPGWDALLTRGPLRWEVTPAPGWANAWRRFVAHYIARFDAPDHR